MVVGGSKKNDGFERRMTNAKVSLNYEYGALQMCSKRVVSL